MTDACRPPEFSVVVASFSGTSTLVRCLESLIGQCAGGEIIAAAALSDHECQHLKGLFPAVQFLASGRDADVFQLRSLGISAARGNWIGLTEDHCLAAPGWVAALRKAIGERHVLVAGPVLPGEPARWTERGLFLCEYANLLPPLDPEHLSFVSGVNGAWPRAGLQACRDVWQSGFYENEVSDALRSAGCEVRVAPGALVSSRLTMTPGGALAHFYQGGRRFGAYRAGRSRAFSRFFRLLSSPAVPFVLLARMLRTLRRRRPRELAAIPGSLPVAMGLLVAWSIGEAIGGLRVSRSAPAPRTDSATLRSARAA